MTKAVTRPNAGSRSPADACGPNEAPHAESPAAKAVDSTRGADNDSGASDDRDAEGLRGAGPKVESV